tara:strand:+ start:14 stop:628 length:615 start_codon:yes stop_codon:yes gene_type:complete
MNPIFSRNDNFRKIAFLNWRMDSEKTQNNKNMAEGYVKSAVILIKECLSDNQDKKADIIIFPILTCLNHGIELYLKTFIDILNRLLKNDIKVDGTHNLNQLFLTFTARIKDLDGQKEANYVLSHFKELKDYIKELVIRIESTPKNDKMDFSRYPYTKDSENHFYVDKWTNIEVDLENLSDLVIDLEKKLDSFSNYLYFDKLNNR